MNMQDTYLEYCVAIQTIRKLGTVIATASQDRAPCSTRQHVCLTFVYLGVIAVIWRFSAVTVDIANIASQFHGLQW